MIDIVERDQAKVFGSTADFAELITYVDRNSVGRVLSAVVEREAIEAKDPAGYGAAVPQKTLRIWIPKVVTVTEGVDRVKVKWRREDAAEIECVVVRILPESEGCYRLECMR